MSNYTGTLRAGILMWKKVNTDIRLLRLNKISVVLSGSTNVNNSWCILLPNKILPLYTKWEKKKIYNSVVHFLHLTLCTTSFL